MKTLKLTLSIFMLTAMVSIVGCGGDFEGAQVDDGAPPAVDTGEAPLPDDPNEVGKMEMPGETNPPK